MDQPKIERMLRLMKMLTGNLNYTIDDLAGRLGMSPRTVYRYLDTFKEAGFVVQKHGEVYCLGRESRHLRELSQLIHFTEEEAYMVNRLIEGLDETNVLKQNLRRKLASVYDCTSMAECVVKGQNALNVHALIEAIEAKRQVTLKDYASSHTGEIRDRKVEPFAFTTNYVQTWCYDTEDGQNKLFQTTRIGSVEVLPDEWQHEPQHREGYMDVFRMSSFEQHRVRLELDVMARNLLTEEYPLAERDLRPADGNHWLLDTVVADYHGVTRFYLGLAANIRIVDSPELEAFVEEYASTYIK